MLNRNWRIILLLIALVFSIWPQVWADFASWLVWLSLAVLLIGELTCDSCAAPSKRKK